MSRDIVQFVARSYESTFLGKRRRNIDSTMRLSISRSNGVTLGRFKPERIGWSRYAIDWLEVVSPALKTPALLCVGSTGPGMEKVRSGTDKLAEVLAAWANGQWAEATSAWSA